MLFERSALSRQPDEVIRRELAHLREAQQLTPDVVLKDPYVLDFLGLNDHYIGGKPDSSRRTGIEISTSCQSYQLAHIPPLGM